MNDTQWLQTACDLYGPAFLARLRDFIEDWDLGDLSPNNIGYLEDAAGIKLPMIIDWLSNCHDDKKVHPSD